MPTKPTKPGCVGFVGALPAESAEIGRQVPIQPPAPLQRPAHWGNSPVAGGCIELPEYFPEVAAAHTAVGRLRP